VWMIRLGFVDAACRRTVTDWYLCLMVSVVSVLLDYIVVLDCFSFPLLAFDSFGLV